MHHSIFKYLPYLIIVTIFSSTNLLGQIITLSSPDEQLSVQVSVGEVIGFKVEYKSHQVMEAEEISLQRTLEQGSSVQLKNHHIAEAFEKITMIVPHKDALIKSHYNQLTMNFKGNFQVIFRAYNDGIAYRFVDQSSKTTRIYNETMDIRFPENSSSFFPQDVTLYSGNERTYQQVKMADIKQGDFCYVPVMFTTPTAKVLFTEAALHNYPGMHLEAGAGHTFSTKFPRYVLKAIPDEENHPDRNQKIEETADYLAQVQGKRNYPWRVFIISDDDRTFVESNLVTQLSNKPGSIDFSWIKPGKVAWDWYNANNIYGVDFEAGLNMETYKYYIDFASKNGIEYVILDEGWTKSTTEILEDNEYLDVPELIRYAKSKNVEIILWVLWKPLYENLDKILQLYSSWGAAGIKVDFIQRSDQFVVESYEKIAEVAARYKLLVDYHGAFKPAGIERVWPNIINYEAVIGNEYNKWSGLVNPEHNVTIPFIRMAAGPMDFTPGAMFNMNKGSFASLFSRPMAYGTRTHQVAMYVVYEAPLQMMCESPTVYYQEKETVDFITQIPTIWDETVVLKGSVGNYIAVARRKGNDWYIGAMTDWDSRAMELDFSFLGEGNYRMESMRDGINAGRNAQDYKMEKSTVTSNSKIQIHLSGGGGWVAIIKKMN